MAWIAAIGAMFQAGMSIQKAQNEAEALQAKAAWNRWQSNRNAFLSDFMADETERQGEEAVHALSRKGMKLLGSQRASYAGQGVKVDVGSASDVYAESRYNLDKDIITLRNNAAKQAWGYRSQADNERLAAKYGEVTGNNMAAGTMFSGQMQALGQGLTGMYKLYDGLKNYRDDSLGDPPDDSFLDETEGSGASWGAQFYGN